MGRIPIYASKAPLRRTPMVRPQPDIAVSEAIGGLAETVGKIAMDWSTKKKDTEIQSEYVSNTIILKEAQATFLKAREDDPNPLDDDYIKSGYDEYMKTNLKDLVWKHNTSQKKFEQTRQISDLGTLQKAYDINRRKFISAEKVQGEIDTQKALNLRSKALIDLNISKLKPVYSTEALDDKRIKDHHDLEVLLIGDKLRIDPNAPLKEFKKVLPEEKNKLIKSAKDSASAEAKRKKTIQQDELKKQQAQLGKDNIEKLHNNTLTWDELVAQKPILTEQQFKGYEHALMTESPEKSDPKVKAELYKRLGLGLLTSTDIMNAYGDLNIPDKKALESAYTTREKNEWGMMIEPNKYQQATKEVDVTLNELVEDGLMSKGDMEEARTNIITRLFDVSKKKNLVDDEILEQKEKLMLPYYKKQLPLLNDDRAWNDFMLGRQKESETERGIAEIKIKELEEKVKGDVAKEKSIKKEKEKETIKIEGIPENVVAQITDWLRKNGTKVIDEENIKYIYEQYK